MEFTSYLVRAHKEVQRIEKKYKSGTYRVSKALEYADFLVTCIYPLTKETGLKDDTQQAISYLTQYATTTP